MVPPSTTAQTCRLIAIHHVLLHVLQICFNALFDVLLIMIVEHVFNVRQQKGYHVYIYIHGHKLAKSQSRNILIGTLSQLFLKDLESNGSDHVEVLEAPHSFSELLARNPGTSNAPSRSSTNI